MKVTLHTKTTSIEAEGETHMALVEQLSSLSEVFSGEACGACKGKEGHGTRYVHRTAMSKDAKPKEFDFFEMRCLDGRCRARLSFGQNNDKVHLFPKRKGDDGSWLPNNGWVLPPARQEA